MSRDGIFVASSRCEIIPASFRRYNSQGNYFVVKIDIQLPSTFFALFLFASACGSPSVQPGQIQVNVTFDGQSQRVSIPAGSTVRDALTLAGAQIELLDRSEPPLYSILSDGTEVDLFRVSEELEIEEVVILYKTQSLPNESLPEGELLLVQSGQNGIQEITYRRVFEEGIEISRTPIQTVVIQEPIPEIVMVGSQALFASQEIPGRLAYISGNNAWLMEGNTGNRKPVVTTGDLDGRIFSLSPDGVWLLYTRSDPDPDDDLINTLWLTRVDGEDDITIDLKTQNVIHFASWIPESNNGISVSTVEFNPNPPGWQANNDLILMYFSENGWVGDRRTIIEANSGGLYGWWGATFEWSSDGEQLAYARPDGVGLVDFDSGDVVSLVDLIPFQTGSDWAWVPGIQWSPDNSFLFTVSHVPQEGLISPEESPLFDLSVIPLIVGAPISIVPQVGMFAYPLPSPSQRLDSTEDFFQIAYLQAINQTQSRTSEYQLVIRDRDGSNPVTLFPPDASPGLAPHRPVWSPEPLAAGEANFIAVIYQGNIWLVNVLSGQALQLTGDGLITGIDWR